MIEYKYKSREVRRSPTSCGGDTISRPSAVQVPHTYPHHFKKYADITATTISSGECSETRTTVENGEVMREAQERGIWNLYYDTAIASN